MSAGGHALTALRGGDYAELLVAMCCALALMACWQASEALQAAGLPFKQLVSEGPLATLHALLDLPSSQLSVTHVNKLVQVGLPQSSLHFTPEGATCWDWYGLQKAMRDLQASPRNNASACLLGLSLVCNDIVSGCSRYHNLHVMSE